MAGRSARVCVSGAEAREVARRLTEKSASAKIV